MVQNQTINNAINEAFRNYWENSSVSPYQYAIYYGLGILISFVTLIVYIYLESKNGRGGEDEI